MQQSAKNYLGFRIISPNLQSFLVGSLKNRLILSAIRENIIHNIFLRFEVIINMILSFKRASS